MSSHAGATSYTGGATESVASSSTRHNWILLNKHESISRKPTNQRVILHKPLLLPSPSSSPIPFRSQPARDALKRISSINRLNDRIRRRLQLQNAISDSSPSVSEEATTATITLEDDRDRPPPTPLSRGLSEASRLRANRVIDDSFRFISDEPSLTNVNTMTPGAKKRLIQHSLTTLHQMSPPPRPPSSSAAAALKRARTDPLGSRPSRGRSDATDSSSSSSPSSSQSSLGPSTSRGAPTATTTTDSRAKLSQTGLVHTIPIKMDVNRRRAESLDSGSDRVGGGVGGNGGSEHDPHPTPMTISEWQTPALSRRPSVGMHFHESSSSRIQEAPPPTPGHIHRREQSFNEARLPPPDYLTSPAPEKRRPRSVRRIPRKTPSLLRRDSYFYRKCDICFNQGGLSCPACGNGFNGRGFGGPPMAGRYNYLLQSRQQPRRQLSRHLDADWITNRRLRPMNGGIVRKASRVPSNLQHRFTAGPPPVTIEPYFDEADEDANDETSASGLADEMEPGIATTSASTKMQGYWSRTIPPRAPVAANVPGWGGIGGYGGYASSTSPRRHISERALNVEALQRHPSYLGYRRGPHIPLSYHQLQQLSSPTPASRQSTVIWPANAGPAWKSIDRRPRASPVFRYGKPLPKWLYDYDAYAEEQRTKEIERRRRKVIAIILIFLFFALIVAAGVVLAAVH
uniref:RING-type domain-containing protein n=1 Tax=Panagrellus redivivus TaxID=6233 RepID=A0A7E4VGJ2_PANRE